jgi:cytochrome P450
MLSPQSAREYVPAMLRAAVKASPKAAEWANRGEILRYLNRCALDLFSAIHFGTGDEMSEQDHEAFCEAAVESLKLGTTLNRDPLVRVACTLGIQTPAVRRFFSSMDTIHEISMRRQKQALDRIQSSGRHEQLSAEDRESYFYKSLRRLEENDDVSLDELMEIGEIIMAASVDTTSTKTAWNVLQLALNPEAQERLRTEILQAVEMEQQIGDRGDGGEGPSSRLTPTVLDTPYLKAFIRETHRCTPVAPFTLSKELSAPAEIHGVELPAGSLVSFESHSPQFDPEFLGEEHDPMEFRPERWLPDAVEARKGTAAAHLDHPFFSGPFSQGSRRCPGSRVAYLEVQSMLAQLVLDWRVEGPENLHWSDVPSSLETMVVPIFPGGVRFVPVA